MYNLPRPNTEKIEIWTNQLLEVNQKFKEKKNPNKVLGQDSFTKEFYQSFREELTPVFLKLVQIIAEERTSFISFCEASNTMIPKPDKISCTKKKITGEHY